MSDVTGAGDVAVITGAITGDEVAGAVTGFENFQGERLTRRYGPADGQLENEPGLIDEHDSGVRTRDLVAEAEFVNPRGSDWYCGFAVRHTEFNSLDIIGLTDERWWFHQTSDVDDDEYTEVADGYLSATNFRSRNHLLLLAFGDSGWFFVNGQLVAKLDLSQNLDTGHVLAMSGFFRSDQGGSTEFENFNVWTP